MTDASAPLSVTVWGENVHEQRDASVRAIYPDGMHTAIAGGIASRLGDAVRTRTVTLQDAEHGLTDEVLAGTDTLTWWGHAAHDDVSDEVVERVYQAVLGGMGLVVLHSGHYSKIFRKLMGTTCSLRWRNERDEELVWTIDPTHPVAKGVPSPLVIPEQEMYGERFDIPTPDELVFVSGFSGGEVFRSGAAWKRGHGRVFYFSPGDQEYPVYHQPEIHQVLANAVQWAAGDRTRPGADDAPQSPLRWWESAAG